MSQQSPILDVFGDKESALSPTAHNAPLRSRTGRNEPCPCGSGKNTNAAASTRIRAAAATRPA